MSYDRNFDRYPSVLHRPSGRMFGGSGTDDVVIRSEQVWITGKYGISTVFPLKDALVSPGDRGGNQIQLEPMPREQNLFQRIISKLNSPFRN